jgi:hypothetical protein
VTGDNLHSIERSYPVRFDAVPPQRYDRVQLVVRLLFVMLVSAIFMNVFPMGLFTLLYLALPVVAAISIANRGATGYFSTIGVSITSALRWLLSLWAYLAFLTDRFPTERETLVLLEVEPGGSPTAGRALLRIIYGLPELFIVWLFGLLGAFIWIVQFVAVLFTRSCPAFLVGYQRGLIRWAARLLAYQGSLVEPYPPFQLAMGREPART